MNNMKKEGYAYYRYDSRSKMHILLNMVTCDLEMWVANKNHAGYGLKYKNTDLEFCCIYAEE